MRPLEVGWVRAFYLHAFFSKELQSTGVERRVSNLFMHIIGFKSGHWWEALLHNRPIFIHRFHHRMNHIVGYIRMGEDYLRKGYIGAVFQDTGH